MRCATFANVINAILNATPLEVLGPNPKRKSFLLTPLADNGASFAVVAVVFTPGVAQPFVVPPGVTLLVDCYVWGAGGNAGASGGALGGGGGGGGGFASSGQGVLQAGTILLIDVDGAGGGLSSSLTFASAFLAAKANSGANGVLDAAGAGGTAPNGAFKFTGGAGFAATGLAGAGGGGGGAAGAYAVGGAGVNQAGGAGGGIPRQNGFGVGGNGGNGGNSSANGTAATFPGGGGGGGGKTGGVAGASANGSVVLFYQPSLAARSISLSNRPDVVPGQGTLNYLPGMSFPTCVSDRDIGDQVTLPWWASSGTVNCPVQITEYLYDNEDDYNE